MLTIFAQCKKTGHGGVIYAALRTGLILFETRKFGSMKIVTKIHTFLAV